MILTGSKQLFQQQQQQYQQLPALFKISSIIFQAKFF